MSSTFNFLLKTLCERSHYIILIEISLPFLVGSYLRQIMQEERSAEQFRLFLRTLSCYDALSGDGYVISDDHKRCVLQILGPVTEEYILSSNINFLALSNIRLMHELTYDCALRYNDPTFYRPECWTAILFMLNQAEEGSR